MGGKSVIFQIVIAKHIGRNETMNQAFIKIIEQVRAIHDRKAHDYSAHGPYENFTRSASISEWFNDPTDKVFITFISTKLTRLATLLNSQDSPNNESIEDSFIDLVTYCALWASYRNQDEIHPEPKTIIPIETKEVMQNCHFNGDGNIVHGVNCPGKWKSGQLLPL
jgi:hypothetical protein